MDEGVGGRHDLQEGRACVLVLEVETERTLVAVYVKVSRTHALGLSGLADVAHRVAFGCLDFDHLRALIGEQHRAVGSEDDIREVDDTNAVQRAGHGCVSFVIEERRSSRAALSSHMSQEGV